MAKNGLRNSVEHWIKEQENLIELMSITLNILKEVELKIKY
jgi:hypothetical protein